MMDEIRRLTSVSDELMVDLSAAVQRSVRLRQAILKWAFEGKLVDQYPSDEPADRLLARIRAEPGGAVPKKKSRRPKKGPS
jgi:type I restriction enzyme S subunit